MFATVEDSRSRFAYRHDGTRPACNFAHHFHLGSFENLDTQNWSVVMLRMRNGTSKSSRSLGVLKDLTKHLISKREEREIVEKIFF